MAGLVFQWVSFLLALTRATTIPVVRRHVSSASSAPSSRIRCDTMDGAPKVCVYSNYSLCYKKDNNKFFVPNDILSSDSEDYASMATPEMYQDYLSYIIGRSICVTGPRDSDAWYDDHLGRECKKEDHIHVFSSILPYKADFDTQRPANSRQGAVMIQHRGFNEGQFFHDLLDNALAEFATVEHAKQHHLLDDRISVSVVGGGTNERQWFFLKPLGASPTSTEDFYAEDACFEHAVVGHIGTQHKNYMMSRAEYADDGWQDQYWMDPAILRQYRNKMYQQISNIPANTFDSNCKGPKILYVKRTKNRIIENEAAMLQTINEQIPDACVKPVVLEDYKLEDQVAMIRDTQVLLATHGASGALAIFLQESKVFLELQGDTWDRRWSLDLAALSGVNVVAHREQRTRVVEKGDPKYMVSPWSYTGYRDQNIQIDVEKFAKSLDRVKTLIR